MAKRRPSEISSPARSRFSWHRSDLLGAAIFATSLTSIAPALPDGNLFAARSAFILIAGVVWLALFWSGRLAYRRRQSLFLIGVAAIIAAMLISAVASPFPLSNLMDGMGTSMGVVTWIALLAIAIGAAGVRIDSRLRTWIALVFAWVLPVAVAGLAQRILGQAVTGPLQNDNFFGLIMLLWFPVAAGMALTSASGVRRALWFAAAGLLAISVLVSGAQSASASIVVEIGAMTALLGPIEWPRFSRALRYAGGVTVGIAGIGVIAVAISGAFGPAGLGWLPSAIQTGLATRAYLWNGAVQLFLSSPLVGHGPDGYMYAAQSVTQPELMRLEHGSAVIDVISADPHSLYLRALANLGLVGAAALITSAVGWVRALTRLDSSSARARGLHMSLSIGGVGFLLGAAFAPWTMMIGATSALVLGLALAASSPSEPRFTQPQLLTRAAISVPLALLLVFAAGSHLLQERFFQRSLHAQTPAEKESLLKSAQDAAPWDHSMHYLRLKTRGEFAGIVGPDVRSFQQAVDSDQFAPYYGPYLADFARLSLEDAAINRRTDLTWETRTLDRAAALAPAIPEVWAERLHLAVVSGDKEAIARALKQATGKAEPASLFPTYRDKAQLILSAP